MSSDYFRPAAGGPPPVAAGPAAAPVDPTVPPPGAHPGWRPPASAVPTPSGRGAPRGGPDPVAPAVLALGGLALLLGAFLPWLQIAGGSLSGVSSEVGTGRQTLAAGVVVLVAAVAGMRGALGTGRTAGLVLVGAFACVRALYERSQIRTLRDLITGAEGELDPSGLQAVTGAFLEAITPSVGQGIWVTVVGGVLVILGAALGLVRAQAA